jgi:hypothetical protein
VTPFRQALERDRRLGRLPDPGVAEWRYIRRTRHDVDQPLVFEYEGPGDLLHWIADRFDRLDGAELSGAVSRSFWRAEPTYIPHRDELIARSASSHELLLSRVGASYGPELHHPQDVYNVQDFHYCTSIGSGIRTVVDYGAGYGRQSFLYGTVLGGARYVCVDAIEQPYMVQRWVFEQLGLARWDYVDDAEESFLTAFEERSGAFHVPSWRLDLLPEASVDLVLFVWSLYEMSGAAAAAAVEACTRLVRLGGYVYIRDVPHSVSYRFDPERRLRQAGFETTYESRTIAGDELHGRQRLYRRVRTESRRVPTALRARVRRTRATRGALAEGRRQRGERRGQPAGS